jgi:hypothetical protein
LCCVHTERTLLRQLVLAALEARPEGLTRTELHRDTFHGAVPASELDELLRSLTLRLDVHRYDLPGPRGLDGPLYRSRIF